MLQIDELFKWPLSVRTVVLLNSPVEEVFAFVTDLSAAGGFQEVMGHYIKTSEGALRKGSTFAMTTRAHSYGGLPPALLTVSEFVTNRKIVFTEAQTSLSWETTLEFEPKLGASAFRYNRRLLHFGKFLTVLGLMSFFMTFPWFLFMAAIRPATLWAHRRKHRRLDRRIAEYRAG